MIGLGGVTRATLGTAAEKVMVGEGDEARLEALTSGCALCQMPCWVGCWHKAARVLLDHGLRPRGEPSSDQLQIEERA